MTVAEVEEIDWTNADYADGPLVAKWITERLRPTEHRKSLYRRINAWKNGEAAAIETLDRHLVALGAHLSELPDDVWRKGAVGNRNAWSHETKYRVLELLREGESIKGTARRLGLSASTVRYHRNKAQEER